MGFAGMNPLLEAILIESSDRVTELLNKFPVDDQDNLLGVSALHLAIYRPQHLDDILKLRPNINARDRRGITPLMYAAGVGDAGMALQLLNFGANPTLEAGICAYHGPRNFLEYATHYGHWVPAIEILGYLRHSQKVSKDDIRTWMTSALVRRFESYHINQPKDSNIVTTLLTWGVDPNFIYHSHNNYFNCNTLAHTAQHVVELRELILHGFKEFNRTNHFGVHALLAVSYDIYNAAHPQLLEVLLDGGSAVNLQDKNGHTSLYVVLQQLRRPVGGLWYGEYYSYNKNYSWMLDRIRLLLNRSADPHIVDDCQCYCSEGRFGCTLSHAMVKEVTSTYWVGFRSDIWAFEYFDILKEILGPETAKQGLLDMLRLLKFQDLCLTHTCCPGYELYWGMSAVTMDQEEIEEIQDEEKETIEVLGHQMRDFEESLGDDPEDQLLTEICLLITCQQMICRECRVKLPSSSLNAILKKFV